MDKNRFDNYRERLVGLSVKHFFGLEKIKYSKNEVIALCLVKNGEQYMKEFIEHYFKLGVCHIVFLDNGSRDKTIEIAKKYDRVTVLRTDFPFGGGNNMRMRDYLVNRFAKDRWSLCVDIDEFFDYPFSDILSIEKLICYLNANDYTAVASHMLDMFPENIVRGGQKKFNRDSHKYYYLGDMIKKDYYFEDGGSAPTDIKIYFGGVRNLLFKLDTVCITKHPLIFSDERTRRGKLGHLLKKGNVADFSAVLFHYKFTDDFFGKVKAAIRQGQYFNNSSEYKKYYGRTKRGLFSSLKKNNSKQFKDTQKLVKEGFLIMSERFRNFPKFLQEFENFGKTGGGEDFTREDVSVIIPWKNIGIKRLENCLKSLRNQDYSADLIKIILVDYGSRRENFEIVRNMCGLYEADYIKAGCAGEWNRSCALNIGIKEAGSKYILVSDIDIVFEKNYITECVAEIRKNALQMVYSEMRYCPKCIAKRGVDVVKNFYKIKPACEVSLWKHYKYKQGVTIIFTLKKYFLDISGYDEFYSLWGWEDTDLIKRFELAGLELKEISDKTSHFHQWHIKHEGVKNLPGFEKRVEENKNYFFSACGIRRNRDGWRKKINFVSPAGSNVPGDLAAVCCYFNPCQYKSRFENYKIFRAGIEQSGIAFLTVELAFGDDPYELNGFSGVTQLRTERRNIMWQKERLLNIGIQQLIGDGYKKIAWLDADIVFENNNWAVDLSEKLEKYPLVQVFKNIYRDEERAGGQYDCGSASYYQSHGKISVALARPGFGWAARAEILEKNFLYDLSVVTTENDTLIFFGNFFRDSRLSHISEGHPCLKNFSLPLITDYIKWARRWGDAVCGQVGYIDHNARALYHGAMKDRRHIMETDIYRKYRFNPRKDIKIGKNGVFEWASDKPDFHKEVREYFYSRKEDD